MTGRAILDAVLLAASVVGALGVLGGLVWWLVKPRVLGQLGRLAADAGYARRQLDPTHQDSTANKVDAALVLVEKIPGLVRRVEELEEQTEPLDAVVAATREHSLQLSDHRRRLGNIEEALITGRNASPWAT